MKVVELEDIINNLKQLKNLTDRQEYRVSTSANQLYNKILPKLEKELNRMQDSEIEIDCPKIMILEFTADDKGSYTELMNKKLQELILNDNKIIDYDIRYYDNTLLGIIKYTP